MKYDILTCLVIWKKEREMTKHSFYLEIPPFLKPWQIIEAITEYILQATSHALVVINMNVDW